VSTSPRPPRTDLDLESFRRLLLEERERLRAEVEELHHRDQLGTDTSELADYDQHQADVATDLILREQDQGIEESLEQASEQVERALQRLAAGQYGYCERCGVPIPAERLEVLPAAAYCVACAAEIG
jgi:RNA polymerase-binding protein DksA